MKRSLRSFQSRRRVTAAHCEPGTCACHVVDLNLHLLEHVKLDNRK
jgi:hypothetical protein